jgi:predicted ribosomally synthesized peptide with SipW-like signal peptide
MIIGFVGLGVGSTTMAMFSDTETSSDNQFTAGELDLTVDWNESYNGEHVETQELTNDPGAIFQLGDVKPGDHGEATVSLHLEDNPGWIWMNLNQTANWDNACTEPEHEAEGQCGSEGELDEELEFVIWADDGDNIKQEDEKLIFEGTAQELEEQSMSEEGVLLDGNPSTNKTEPFSGEETGYIGIKYEIPLETGNQIQGDSLKYDISFYTEQRRHNENPDNLWEGSENSTEDSETPEEPEEPSPTPASFDPKFTGCSAVVIYTDDESDQYEIVRDSDEELEKVQVKASDSSETFNSDHPQFGSGEEGVVGYKFDYDKTVGVIGENSFINSNYNPEDMSCSNSSGIAEGEKFDWGNEFDEEAEASGNLTFNDQEVDDGQVTINNVSTNADTTVYVTYEDGNDTIIAGIHNAPAGLNNFNPMTVDINESGVSGEHTTRMIQKPVAIGYNPGDVLQESTLEKQYFSQSAQITAETEYTATQGDTTVELEPIEGDETVQEFYDFRLPDRYDSEDNRNATNGASFPGSGPYYGSAGTEDIQQGDTSIMFLYEGPDGLSFVVVHEGDGSSDGGSASFQITDLNGNGEWVVKDDLYLGSDGTLASSNYDRWYTTTNTQTIDWTWGGGGSDGGAFQTLSDNFEFTISPSFNEESELYEQFYNGDVDEWQVISGNRNNPDRTTLNMSEEVTIKAE